jgi:SAM-dependent methyltransferase
VSEYPLQLSDVELDRYRFMAETAAAAEADLWTAAGVAEGAAVADVGCGPGAVSAVLARLVGPTGRVVAVDRDPNAVALARAGGAANLTVSVGEAHDTGLEPSSVDAVMIRHVLAHNGAQEQAIVDHAATLVRPGGRVYLADIDMSALRMRPQDARVADLDARYREWHSRRGNDLSVGLRLGELLTGAGLEDVAHHGRYQIFPARPGFRTPAWAARDALVADGLATAEDIDGWAAAFEEYDASEARPTMFVPLFFAIGRRPAG